MRTGIYRHYKGGYYQLIGLAEHTETGECLVVYVALEPSLPGLRLRARPLNGPDGWNTPVQNPNLSQDHTIPRFEWNRD
jgi:hypothetical protein